MRSIILCEGYTDFVLLQYFLRQAYGWQDKSSLEIRKNYFNSGRTLVKGENSLDIGGCDGCSKILPAFGGVLEMNRIGAKEERYDRIVIIADRDEIDTEERFINTLKETCIEKGIVIEQEPVNDQWINCKCLNGQNREIEFQILLLMLPFEETGAMETFLLNGIAAESPYDAKIIRKCSQFVDTVDDEKRYLKNRRHITKAKFDVYFSVRTPVQQFKERQKILKGVEWEKYSYIQTSLQKLAEL